MKKVNLKTILKLVKFYWLEFVSVKRKNRKGYLGYLKAAK